MEEQKKRAEPIRQSVDVDCSIEDAFELFTKEFGAWWPLAEYSVAGDEAESCTIEPWAGGRVFERTGTGEEHDWGSVRRWDPPSRLSLAWDPGCLGDASQTVDVQFEEVADGTRVTVTHSSWETPGIAVCAAHTNCDGMWAAALRRFFCNFVADQMVAV
jgi:uncharacterized protein YndB with AHSA1/START domain